MSWHATAAQRRVYASATHGPPLVKMLTSDLHLSVTGRCESKSALLHGLPRQNDASGFPLILAECWGTQASKQADACGVAHEAIASATHWPPPCNRRPATCTCRSQTGDGPSRHSLHGALGKSMRRVFAGCLQSVGGRTLRIKLDACHKQVSPSRHSVHGAPGLSMKHILA